MVREEARKDGSRRDPNNKQVDQTLEIMNELKRLRSLN
jgi:hypothetical protein